MESGLPKPVQIFKKQSPKESTKADIRDLIQQLDNSLAGDDL